MVVGIILQRLIFCSIEMYASIAYPQEERHVMINSMCSDLFPFESQKKIETSFLCKTANVGLDLENLSHNEIVYDFLDYCIWVNDKKEVTLQLNLSISCQS